MRNQTATYAVCRYDFCTREPREAITVKEIVPTLADAERRVCELNERKKSPLYTYFFQITLMREQAKMEPTPSITKLSATIQMAEDLIKSLEAAVQNAKDGSTRAYSRTVLNQFDPSQGPWGLVIAVDQDQD